MEFLEPVTNSPMDRIYELQTKLLVNVREIETISENINRIKIQTPEDIATLEFLYSREFSRYMDNIGLYEDLVALIDAEPKNQENEFELMKIRRDIKDLCLVEVVDI